MNYALLALFVILPIAFGVLALAAAMPLGDDDLQVVSFERKKRIIAALALTVCGIPPLVICLYLPICNMAINQVRR